MMKSFAAAALLAGMVGPVSAATVLDFTANDNVNGSFDGIGWNVTAEGGSLVDARHKNNVNCAPFACVVAGSGNQKYDVGFGISGANNNEIDTPSGDGIAEAVVVTFTNFVKITGFAGMLAYLGENDDDEDFDGEAVQLEYSVDFGATWMGLGAYIATAQEAIGTNFDTVGLAYLKNLSLIANAVRFTATGDDDDGTINVTAAALHVAPVPVPASFPLLLAGIGALGWAARRKQRKSA